MLNQEQQEKGKAIPFITWGVNNKGFEINVEAENYLKNIKQKVGIISIIGKYRTGKSFFVNRVLLEQQDNGFQVAPTINSCTKGIWLWNQPLKSENPDYKDMCILVMDTEGFGGIDQNVNHDSRIFIFSLLLSSYLIYNSVGNIDEFAFQSLSLIVNLAKEISLKNNMSSDCSFDDFPQFLWVVRDFTLKMADSDGNVMSPKEYLEQALTLQKGISDSIEQKNRVRRLLKHFFKERDCSTLIRPIEDELSLQKINCINNDQLRPEFIQQIQSLHKRILKRVKPKIINGQFLDGASLVQIIQAYIQAINSGSVPNIETAWVYICRSKQTEAVNECFLKLENHILNLDIHNSPVNNKQLKNLRNTISHNLLQEFKAQVVGYGEDINQNILLIQNAVFEKFQVVKQQNNIAWENKYSQWIFEKSQQIQEKIKCNEYTDFYEFKMEYQKLIQQFQNEMSNDNQIYKLTQKLILDAAENITRSKSSELNHYQKTGKERLDFIENELMQYKLKYEEDKEVLLNRIQQIEIDKAQFKAQEKIAQEQLHQIKQEKYIVEQQLIDKENIIKQQLKNEKLLRNQMQQIEFNQNNSVKQLNEIQNEKALFQQENEFLNRDNTNIHQKLEELQEVNLKLHNEIYQYTLEIQNLKEKIKSDEAIHKKKLGEIQLEQKNNLTQFEQQISQSQEIIKLYNDLLIEKSFMEQKIQYLSSQLQQNKTLHDALLLALKKGMDNQENNTRDELLKTNRKLCAELEKLEQKCNELQNKNKECKQYKKIYKNCQAVQCTICSKFITKLLFLQHFENCSIDSRPNTTYSTKQFSKHILYQQQQKQQYQYQQKQLLNVQINQTIVKENEDCQPYTEYIIQVHFNNSKWNLHKKYKMFCQLHQDLVSNYPYIQFPQSSSVIISKNLTASALNGLNHKKFMLIEERKKQLELYLRDLISIDLIRNSSILKQFFGLNQQSEEQEEEELKEAEEKHQQHRFLSKSYNNVYYNKNTKQYIPDNLRETQEYINQNTQDCSLEDTLSNKQIFVNQSKGVSDCSNSDCESIQINEYNMEENNEYINKYDKSQNKHKKFHTLETLNEINGNILKNIPGVGIQHSKKFHPINFSNFKDIENRNESVSPQKLIQKSVEKLRVKPQHDKQLRSSKQINRKLSFNKNNQ